MFVHVVVALGLVAPPCACPADCAGRCPVRHRRLTPLPSMLSDAASDGSGMASEGPDLDMGALATRIADVQALPAPEAVRIFDLDAMVPRQRLAFDAPQAFVDQLDQAEADGGKALVMVGRELSALNSHGVEVEVETVQRRSDGTGAAVTLVAGRFCEVISVGDDEGSRWLGRSGTVCWVSLDLSKIWKNCAC